MTRSLIIRLFWGSIVGLVAGFGAHGRHRGLGYQQRRFREERARRSRIRSGVLSWTLLGLMALAVFVLLFAAVSHFVA